MHKPFSCCFEESSKLPGWLFATQQQECWLFISSVFWVPGGGKLFHLHMVMLFLYLDLEGPRWCRSLEAEFGSRGVRMDLPASLGWWDAEVVQVMKDVLLSMRVWITCLKSHLGYVNSSASSFLCLLFLLPSKIWCLVRQRPAQICWLNIRFVLSQSPVSFAVSRDCYSVIISGYFTSLHSTTKDAHNKSQECTKTFRGGKNLVLSQAEMCSPVAWLCFLRR